MLNNLYIKKKKLFKTTKKKVEYVKVLLVIIPDWKMGSGSCLINKVQERYEMKNTAACQNCFWPGVCEIKHITHTANQVLFQAIL